MYHLIIGAGYAQLHLRFARSLKDRRKVVSSIIQKLKNNGFSAVDIVGPDENPKFAGIGFSYVVRDSGHVEAVLEEAKRLFIGDFEIVDVRTELLDFSSDDEPEPESEELKNKYDP